MVRAGLPSSQPRRRHFSVWEAREGVGVQVAAWTNHDPFVLPGLGRGASCYRRPTVDKVPPNADVRGASTEGTTVPHDSMPDQPYLGNGG